MLRSGLTLAAFFTLALSSTKANALSVFQDFDFDQDAQVITATFTDLPMSGGSSGVLTIAERGLDSIFPGIDLNGPGETFTVSVDDHVVGIFGEFMVDDPLTNPVDAMSCMLPVSAFDCTFSVALALDGLFLQDKLQDNELVVELAFSNRVDAFPEDNDIIRIQLDYTPVPLPASALLLRTGLAGLVGAGRYVRKRA